MSSEIDQIADAVTTSLTNAQFNTDGGDPSSALFIPRRLYVPVQELAALSELTVLVVPTADAVSKYARDSALEDIIVNVGVLQKLAAGVDGSKPEDNAEIDPLVRLSRAIALMYSAGQKAGDASWFSSQYPLIFDPDRMRTSHVFQAVISFTFKQAQ